MLRNKLSALQAYSTGQRERLQSKLEDAQVQLENNRLEQELVLMAQRV
ncbi:hypothetical protein F9U45_22765, partial [Pectobacterium versatile]|nr:hypothetical protein [Pectobacterium versatile]